MAEESEESLKLKKLIGARLRELREDRGETLDDVAERINPDRPDKSLISRIENGKANPELANFIEYLTVGMKIEFGEFCSYFVTGDEERRKEECASRKLLEALLREGPTTRREVLNYLKEINGKKASPEETAGSLTTRRRGSGRANRS